MVCIAERIKMTGNGNTHLGYMVLCKDHYEWEPDRGPYTYSKTSLLSIANVIDEYNCKLMKLNKENIAAQDKKSRHSIQQPHGKTE